MESSTSAPPRTRPSASRSTPPPENTLGGNRPRTVLEVLCRELGTSHPDAALRQIRTMKRLLRQRHRAARKLRRLDVDGAEEAARTIADLQSRIRTLKSEYKAQAEERIAVINTMARALETLRQRLRASAPEAAEGTSATDAPAHTNGTANTNGVPQSAPHAEMEVLSNATTPSFAPGARKASSLLFLPSRWILSPWLAVTRAPRERSSPEFFKDRLPCQWSLWTSATTVSSSGSTSSKPVMLLFASAPVTGKTAAPKRKNTSNTILFFIFFLLLFLVFAVAIRPNRGNELKNAGKIGSEPGGGPN
ncbi:MAG: hypothetical protein R6U20_01350 [Longimonas sp.]